MGRLILDEHIDYLKFMAKCNEEDKRFVEAVNETVKLVRNMESKLAHYEDLEEQGRLIEQKHGTWLEADDGDGVVCSVCRTDFCTLIFETDSFIYCPHCGAKLKELEGDKE